MKIIGFSCRSLYNAEKTRLRNEIEKLSTEVQNARNRLQRETDWKEKMEADHKHVMLEKRRLLAQFVAMKQHFMIVSTCDVSITRCFRLTDVEEEQRDQKRQLNLSEVKVKYLEEENATLQQRIDALTLQKHNLDRIVKEFQMERHREVSLCSSGLTTSAAH